MKQTFETDRKHIVIAVVMIAAFIIQYSGSTSISSAQQRAVLYSDVTEQQLCGGARGDNPLYVPINRRFYCTLQARQPTYYFFTIDEEVLLSIQLEDLSNLGTFSIWKGIDTTYGSLRFDNKRSLNEYFVDGNYVLAVVPGNSAVPYSFSIAVSTAKILPSTQPRVSVAPTITVQPTSTLNLFPSESPVLTPIIYSTPTSTVIPVMPTLSATVSPAPKPLISVPLILKKPLYSSSPLPTQVPKATPEPVPNKVPVETQGFFTRFFTWFRDLFR